MPLTVLRTLSNYAPKFKKTVSQNDIDSVHVGMQLGLVGDILIVALAYAISKRNQISSKNWSWEICHLSHRQYVFMVRCPKPFGLRP